MTTSLIVREVVMILPKRQAFKSGKALEDPSSEAYLRYM
jgi:hypothetical protein